LKPPQPNGSEPASKPYDAVVVGANAAVDTYYELQEVRPGQVNRIRSVRDTAGGKANNLARALLRLGGHPLVVGIAAGRRGTYILDELAREGIDNDYVIAEGNARLNTTLLATAARETTVLLEPGQPVLPEALEAMAAKVEQWALTVGCVVLTGSLPPGGPADLYARLTRMATAAQALVAVDASGEVLRQAAEAGPSLVKINRAEFESAFPGQSSDWARLRRQYQALAGSGLKTLCVTHGAHGAVFLNEDDQFWVRTDVPEWVSTVGAGDTFLAGLLFALRRGASLREAASLASAAASANLQVLGCGFIETKTVNHYLTRTTILEAQAFFQEAAV
jgi:1-phosphofructokinase family hexose kinase